MKLTPMLLGACGIALTAGGVAGASISTAPVQRGSDVLEEIALAATTHPRDKVRSQERAPADSYAMETPEGLVEVDELEWYGRGRKHLGGRELDFEADDRAEAQLAHAEYQSEYDAPMEEAPDDRVIAMRSPVDPSGYAAYDAPAPLELSRPVQVAYNDQPIVRPEDASRNVGSSRMINVQAALASQ